MKFKVMVLTILVGFNALSVQANELPDGPRIVISEMAGVDTTLDIATLTIGTDITARDMAPARKQADERVAQYLSFLGQNQIVKKDISVVNLRTRPDYGYQDGKSVLKGCRTVCTVEVTLYQLDKLNTLLDDALKTGLNEIRSVSLNIAQPDTYKDKARKVIVDDAIHQAKQLVAGFNSKLGPVHSVRYYVSNYRPSSMVRMIKVDVASATFTQEAYEQLVIRSDDQVGAIFQIELTAGQPAATPAKTQ